MIFTVLMSATTDCEYHTSMGFFTVSRREDIEFAASALLEDTFPYSVGFDDRKVVDFVEIPQEFLIEALLYARPQERPIEEGEWCWKSGDIKSVDRIPTSED